MLWPNAFYLTGDNPERGMGARSAMPPKRRSQAGRQWVRAE
jgi:nitrous oxide reductase accessory protein NosL